MSTGKSCIYLTTVRHFDEMQLIEEFLANEDDLDIFVKYRGYEAKHGTAAKAFQAFQVGRRVLTDLNLMEYL